MPPYRRSYASKKPAYRRKYKPKATGGAMATAFKALKIATALKGIINSEKKFFDTNLTTAISSTALITSLSGVAQGDDVSSREGRSIMVKSLQMRSTVALNASATASRVRVIIFSDRQNQGSTPDVTDLLISSSPEALRTLGSEQGRFHVYYDHCFSVDNASKKQATIDKYLYLGNHHVKFEGTGAANIGSGSLWCLQVSNEATNTPSQNTNFRLRYFDN